MRSGGCGAGTGDSQVVVTAAASLRGGAGTPGPCQPGTETAGVGSGAATGPVLWSCVVDSADVGGASDGCTALTGARDATGGGATGGCGRATEAARRGAVDGAGGTGVCGFADADAAGDGCTATAG